METSGEGNDLEERYINVHRGGKRQAPPARKPQGRPRRDHIDYDDEFYDDPLNEITPREREVLYWLSHGLTNKEIAQRMILSEKTVKNHVSHLLKKLDLTDRTKAAALAWKEGLPQIAEEFFSLPAVQPMLK